MPELDCGNCGHDRKYHGPDGCEVERGDGYIGGTLQALGPCGCKAAQHANVCLDCGHEVRIGEWPFCGGTGRHDPVYHGKHPIVVRWDP